MGSRIIGISVAVIVAMVVRGAFAPSLNDQLKSACEQTNKLCPKMVDQITRLDKCTAGDMQVVFHYTIMGPKLDPSVVDAAFKEIQTQTAENTKTSSDTKKYFDQGVKFTHRYSDESGALIKEFDVTK